MKTSTSHFSLWFCLLSFGLGLQLMASMSQDFRAPEAQVSERPGVMAKVFSTKEKRAFDAKRPANHYANVSVNPIFKTPILFSGNDATILPDGSEGATHCPDGSKVSTNCPDSVNLPTHCLGFSFATWCPNGAHQATLCTASAEGEQNELATYCVLEIMPTECFIFGEDDSINTPTFCEAHLVMPTYCKYDDDEVLPTLCHDEQGVQYVLRTVCPPPRSNRYPTYCPNGDIVATNCAEDVVMPTLCWGGGMVATQCPDGTTHGDCD